MQLQVSTDYAIRILQYLHIHRNELPTAKTVAQAAGITYPFFIKLSSLLKHQGLIQTTQGRNGGYQLARPAEKISLYDVYRAVEGELNLNRCLEEDQYCSRDAVAACPFHNYFGALQESLITELSSKYIADFDEETGRHQGSFCR